mmetsp:Transcript_14144/g.21160  ORF Transcript_14144/g.21160 Transcript_14144/m.21160 type:complete len:777 (-) Transcript_14144:162-2492(-)|eukprot:CAMPEP_0185031480 /NCGR_PEP_ID=MMETSP1103-20130426/18988_1 /TAXON_ID=36769 /ORGANISM="Paraphysomonas bandaiensis, Strain Caron Lab Isolate" /LENGTH=776 /DNA_ID=CAMNT_0027567023 /DNA_START=60 /DNA_END=2390 /DNA_ORIENTATION=-
MDASILDKLPDWRQPSSCYCNKVLTVHKNNANIGDISLSNKECIVFGRKKDQCDVVLDHQSISRKHAVLFFGEQGSVYLMDLGSSHGTSVDGRKIEHGKPVLVACNSEIRFGQSSRRYVLSVKPSRPEVPVFCNDTPVSMEGSTVSNTKAESIVTESVAVEEQRKLRQAEIAAYAQEMSSTVPIFKSSTKLSAASLVDAQTAEAEADGATVELPVDSIELDNEDDESSSDDDSPGSAPSSDAANPAPVVQPIDHTPAGDVESFALSRKIPLSHQVDLTGHSKAVVCLSLEHSGNRVVTGSLDYNIKFYDFGGMDRRHLSFKTVEVEEGHPVQGVSHSPSGDRFVVCTGSCQPKVYTRDGEEVITFCRGDMYLRDLSNTKGHTMEVTGVEWHPEDKNIILSSGLEGALRLWDLRGEANFGNLMNKHVLKIRGKTGQTRVGATCCSFNRDGSKMIGGATDGTIHIWNTRKHYSRADIVIQHANVYEPESSVISVKPSPLSSMSNLLASRGEDGTLRLWNLLSPKVPLRSYTRVENVYPTANVEFSPDGTFLCCCTSLTGKSADVEEKSMLYFYDIREVTSTKNTKEQSPCLGIGVSSESSAICVKWQPKTNQIFCSTSNGKTRVFFDPRLSQKGAVLTAGRNPKRLKDPSDYAAVGEIYNPNALPMYKEENASEARIRKAAIRRDPVISKIPERTGAGATKQAENTSFFFTQYVMEGRKADMSHREDPREALLKLDDIAKKDPIFFGSAYASTQPKTQLHDESFEQEQEKFKKQRTML